MAMPLASPVALSAVSCAKLAPGTSDSTRLEAPPEIRNSGSTSGGSSSTQLNSRSPAASERWSGMGWALSSISTFGSP